MPSRTAALTVLALACVAAGPAVREPDSPAAPRPGVLSYLEANRGQTDPSVDFIARCGSYMAWIRPCDVVVSLPAAAPRRTPGRTLPPAEPEPPAVMDVRLVGAVARPARPQRVLEGASNYLIGRDESRWVVGVPHVSGARYAESWPGVDVVWTMDARRLHVEFEVAPGADPAAVGLAFDGTSRPVVDRSGALRVASAHGDAALSAPVAFQPGGGRVDVRWDVREDGSAGFALGRYDRGLPLTIDPTLTYSTYLGGTAQELPGGVAVDSSNNVYMGGTTFSSNLPVTSGAWRSSLVGGQDSFCIKMNSSGSTLGYCTYVGGGSGEIATGVAVDSSGNAFMAGYTSSSDFPVSSGAAATSMSGSGSYSGYVVKLNSTGSARTYATYVNNGYCWCLAIDSSGSAYVGTQLTQIIIYKLNASGTSFSYSTTYGVTNATQERPTGIAVDSGGNAYVAGYTEETTFPTTTGAYDTSYSGGVRDGFLFKLNSSGGVAWSTFLGGNAEDTAQAVALDSSGNPWVTGYTKSANFPTVNPYASQGAGDADAFVTKVDPGGASLAYSTYLGGGGTDYGFAIAVRGAYVYVAGMTTSIDFPTSSPYQSQHGGAYWDEFLSVIRCDGALESSTFLGGSGYDQVENQGVAADSSGDAYVYGHTSSSNFPTQNAYDTTLGGSEDVCLSKLTGVVTPFTVAAATLPDWTRDIAFSQTFATAGAIGSVSWTVSAGALPAGLGLSSAGTISGTPTASGNFTFTLRAVDSCQQTATRQFTFLINPPPTIAAVAPQKWTRTRPYSFNFTGAAGTPPLTFSVATGTLPPGLALTSSGLLSGTLTTTGPFSFDARVTDLRGATATTAFSIDVAEVPAITTSSLPDCTERVAFAVVFTSTGGTQPLSWSVVSGTFPFSKTVDAALGKVDAVTIASGTHTFTLRVTDAAGAAGERELSMLLNPTPQIDTVSVPLAVAGRAYSTTLAGHGGSPPVKWHPRNTLPTGLGMAQDTGLLSGTPTLGGSTSVRFGYDDDCGGKTERGIQIDVASLVDLARRKAKISADFDEVTRKDPQYFALEMIEGTVLSAIVKPKTKGSLPVDVELLSPSVTPIDLAGVGAVVGNSFKIIGFTVPATGRYFLRLSPRQPFTGTILASVSVAAQSAFGGTLHLDSAEPPADLRIPALAGAKLTLSVKGAKGGTLSPEIRSVAENGFELLVPGEVKGSGLSRTLKLRAPLTAGEAHVLLGAAPGTSGDAAWSIKLKQPKTYAFSMPDVPAGN